MLCRLWDQHQPRLLLIARSIGQPAEDAVQEAFIELAKLPMPPDDPLGWMVRVIRNRMITWHRGERRRQDRETTRADPRWFDQTDPSLGVDAAELTAAVHALPALQRQAIVMHLWGEMTFVQIGQTLETSSSTAHRHYSEGLRALRDRFSDEAFHVLNP